MHTRHSRRVSQPSPDDSHTPHDRTHSEQPLPESATQLTPKRVMMLSRQVGNQAVGRLLSRQNTTRRIQRWGPPDEEVEERVDPFENVDQALIDFTKAFNKEFKPIRSVIRKGVVVPKKPQAPNTLPITESPTLKLDATDLDPFMLEHLFTDGQRRKLMDYFQTNMIPNRLFNGDDIGNTNANQRIVIAAHIIANGEYKAGSFEQEVHARFCGHWAQIVWAYAGATPASHLSKGIAGNFDHAGNIVLGSWATRYEQPFYSRYTKDLPDQEEPAFGEDGGLGPIAPDSKHFEAYMKALEKGKTKGRFPGKTMEQINTLQPGDWIYIYNANAAGNHSVIFVDWVDDTQTVDDKVPEAQKVKYRRARIYDQGDPDYTGGGRVTTLGNAYYRGDVKINPVVFISRVSANANPAQSVDDLLPSATDPDSLGAKMVRKAEKANIAFADTINKREKRKGTNRIVDLDAILRHMQEVNKGRIEKIAHRLTPGQFALLMEANGPINDQEASDPTKPDEVNNSTTLETVIFLYQRLKELAHNVDVYEDNLRKSAEKKDVEHANYESEMATLDAYLADLEASMNVVHAEIDSLQAEYALFDLGDDVKALKAEYRRLKRKYPKKEYPADHPNRDEIDLRDEVYEEWQSRQEFNDSKHAKEMRKQLQGQIDAAKRKLNKPVQVQTLDDRVSYLEEQLAMIDHSELVAEREKYYKALAKEFPKRKFPVHAERDAAEEDWKSLQAVQNSKEMKSLRRDLNAQLKDLRAKQRMGAKSLQKNLNKRKGEIGGSNEPYILVHPGNNRTNQLKVKLTGKLEDVFDAKKIRADFMKPDDRDLSQQQ